MARRFEETVDIRKVSTETGFTQASNSLLSRLEQFSQQVTTIAATKSAESGAAEAAQVQLEREGGITKAPKKRKVSFGEKILTGGISTKQYNKSLETAYLSSLGNDIKEGIKGIEAENTSNIAEFNEKVSGFSSGILQGVDPAARQRVSQFLENQISDSRIRVHSNTIIRNKSEAAAESTAAVTSFGNEAALLSREGNRTGAAEQILNAFETIEGMVSAGELKSDRAAILKREINREASEQGNRKKFDDLIKIEGAQAAEKELNKIKGKTPKGWTPDEWDTYTNSQQVDINRQLSKQESVRQEIDKRAQIALSQYESAVSLGFEVSPQEKVRVKELVSGKPQQEQFDRINRTAAFSVLSNNDRVSKLNELETGELDNVADFSAMLKANSQINKAAQKDGYALGVQQGLIDLIPFDPASPESMLARSAQADTLSGHYGVPVSPLTDAEADSLSNSIDGMTIAEKVQLATTLNQAPSVWGQISEKNQPAFSMAGATGDISLMSAVFKGQELLAEKLVVAPKSADYLPVLESFVGDVYGTQDKSAIVEAAKNHYVATADSGILGGDDVFNIGAFENSLNAVTGGIGEINGFKIELPRGTDEDTFDEFIDGFTPSLVESLGGALGFTDEEASDLIQDGRIKNVGANKYIIMVNDNQSLFKTDGTPFTIEWTEQATADIRAERFISQQKAMGEFRRTIDERR